MFQWSDEYLVGEAKVDTEHKALFSLARRLHQALLEGRGKEVLGSLLDNLELYVKQHFAHEEEWMRQLRYPEMSTHCRQHEQLGTQLVDVRNRARQGAPVITIELMQFLEDWLKKHTTGSDRVLAQYARTRRSTIGAA